MSVDRRSFLASTVAAALCGLSRSFAVQGASEDRVLELRQYTLRGGQRDNLIALFERTFIESQNVHGVHVLGTFRDLADPDRFVWIRGFRDMESRKTSLEGFYKDPVWLSNRAAVAATAVDTDNVLLLRPAAPGEGLTEPARPPPNAEGVIIASLYYLGSVESLEFTRFFDRTLLPKFPSGGARTIARLVTEEAPNNFPRLPVREHERVFVWLGRCENLLAANVLADRLASWSGWRDAAPESVLPALMRKPERLLLKPTERSPLQ